MLEALNRIDEALACYDRALALAPDFTEARNNRGRVLLGLDRADDAIENFSIALRLNPSDAEAWYQRGRHLLDLSRNDEAAADLAQALALKPGHAEARFAACIAELPVIYADESEIPRRRTAYEQKLRALSQDIDAGLLDGNIIKALAAKQPFLLAYQGGNDRELQQIYGEMITRTWRVTFRRRRCRHRPRPASRSASASSAASSTATPTGKFRSRAGSASSIAADSG